MSKALVLIVSTVGMRQQILCGYLVLLILPTSQHLERWRGCSAKGCCHALVQWYTEPNTEVWSDKWRAYHNVGTLPNVSRHQTVNHSLHFEDPVTGVHIESYWNWVKTKLKQMKGCHRHQLLSYLDEFVWFERHGTTVRQAFDNICRDIALKYLV